MATVQLAAAQPPAARSGYDYLTPQEQQLQDDNFANPGLLWVDQGSALFTQQTGNQPACASCHNIQDLQNSAAQHPKYVVQASAVLNLEQRINRCRTEQQQLPALPYESDQLLSLTAYIAHLGRGQPIAASVDGAAAKSFESGRRYYYQRRGQLNLACYHCHENNAGNMLRGDRLSQGQATGYPAYKLEWQQIGSLHRRLRDCDIGVRAEPLPYGDPQYVDLELYLAWRAMGLTIETPAVRR